MPRLSPRLLMALLVLSVAACGKKGPPLAPIVRIPAAIETITPLRVGNDVYLTLTVPRLNIDGTQPIDILEVRVYAYTGRTPPPRNRFAGAWVLRCSGSGSRVRGSQVRWWFEVQRPNL